MKGIKELQERAKKMAEQYQGGGNYIRRLILKPDEIARIRFLTDGGELYSDYFHTVKTVKNDREFFRSEHCTRDAEGDCQYCYSEEKNVGFRSIQMYFWVYVHYILHKQQNPKRESDKEAPLWKKVKRGEFIYYKEDINQPQILQRGRGSQDAYVNKFAALMTSYSTLLDRDYDWMRQGATKDDTSYDLIAQNASEMAEELKKLREELPFMEEVAKGKIISFGGSNDDEVGKKKDVSEEIESILEEDDTPF